MPPPRARTDMQKEGPGDHGNLLKIQLLLIFSENLLSREVSKTRAKEPQEYF